MSRYTISVFTSLVACLLLLTAEAQSGIHVYSPNGTFGSFSTPTIGGSASAGWEVSFTATVYNLNSNGADTFQVYVAADQP